ncbi:hypothetical protein [Novosphingobium sp.]|uniref:hypothetical protein n=1 Tax=Novosphingobium sp. TaxID=1874826 RepID=UPI00286D25FA|nr:hypothetical protein [Novosphingobium sp.]
MRRAVLVLTLLSAAACGPSPEDKAREDAAAIAAVNAAQNRLPPIKALALEQFTPADFARMDDTGASCAFYSETRAIAMARPSYGWIKLDGELIRLVSDSGSQVGPLGTYSHYTGRALTMRIDPAGAAAEATNQTRLAMPAMISVHDQWDRVVFGLAGDLRCASQ